MAKKLDAAQIERERHQGEKSSHREEEKQRIRETIAKNRTGERKVTVIMPAPKEGENAEDKKIRVAAYCRVSTDDDDQVGSFEMQVHHFTSIIENNPQYEMVRIYKDEGVSGTSISKRKDFLEMMEDAKAGKIDLILTKSISRFGRNVVDVLTSLRELNNLSPPVTVSFETEGITSAGSNNLRLAVLASVAQMESEQRSLAVKAGIRYRMQEGLYKFTVKNTIGYYRDYAGMLKIEPAEAQIVEYIYDSYLEGASFTAIADSLTQQGIRSRRECPVGSRVQFVGFSPMKSTAATFFTKSLSVQTASVISRSKTRIFCLNTIGKTRIRPLFRRSSGQRCRRSWRPVRMASVASRSTL